MPDTSGGQARRMDVRSVDVEEELLIVEPATGRPRALAGACIRAVGQAAGRATARRPVKPAEWRAAERRPVTAKPALVPRRAGLSRLPLNCFASSCRCSN